MRTLVHLSDLHFGTVDPVLVGPLVDRIRRVQPDVVVVSGDLTQRARSEQFKDAREFLDRLPRPLIVVPGNHDVPMGNVFDRFLRPLQKYRAYIDRNVEPSYVDREIAVLGVNTARSGTIKSGRISGEQIARLRTQLEPLGAGVVKIIVTHHPFDLPTHHDLGDLVGRAPQAMQMFAACRVDMLLAGHMHASHAGDTAVGWQLGGFSALAVQAGTALSTRRRDEVNSFNVIRIAPRRISVDRFSWEAESGGFEPARSDAFEQTASGWSSALQSKVESGRISPAVPGDRTPPDHTPHA
ncbi:MAG: metallophosphoesterase family protein [Gemmatimonadaceae bacterium]